jgi:outer membrane receptor protein involved in Fe transport
VNYLHGGLSLTAAAAYTDAKTKGNICAVAADTAADCSEDGDEITAPSGTRLPVTPKFKITGTARYTWAMGPGKAHVQIGVVHQGSAPTALRIADEATLGTLPASTLVDLFAGYDWRNMNFEVFGTNIFDRRNQLSRFIICGSFCNAPEFIHIVPGRPRTIGIRAGMKF